MYAISIACNLGRRTNKLRNELAAFKISLAAFYIYACTKQTTNKRIVFCFDAR